MDYGKYFKPQQKVLLRPLTGEGVQCVGVIATSLVRCGETHFDLALPSSYVDEMDLPFDPGMNFHILSEAFGMGLQLNGNFQERIGRAVIRVNLHGDMEAFSRREHFRAEVTAGFFCKRGMGTLRSYHELWHAAVQAQADGAEVPEECHPQRMRINLSAGGCCTTMASPVSLSELCMALIDLGDGSPPIWTLGEVAWMQAVDAETCQVGLRFVEIVTSDQERISNFVVKELKNQGQDVPMYGSRQELLQKMQFA